MQEKVTAIHADLRDIDLRAATIVVVYLLPEAVEGLKDKLRQVLEQDGRVVCNTWGPRGWVPRQKVSCGFSDNVVLYLYDRSSLPLP